MMSRTIYTVLRNTLIPVRVFLFVLVVIPVFSYSQNLKIIQFKGSDFTVRLPETPLAYRDSSVNVLGDTTFQEMYMCSDQIKNTYLIVALRYSNAEILGNCITDTSCIDKIFMSMLEGGASKADLSIEHIKKNYTKNPFWTCKLKGNSKDQVLYYKILLVKNKVYSYGIMGKPQNITLKQVENFYNSFTVK